MVALVADLKAERDELKHDVEGWRMRVSDLEKQLAVVGNRVEVERREAWVARTRVGLLEVERSGLDKYVGELESENKRLLKGEEELNQQVARLLQDKEKMVVELQKVRSQVCEVDPLSTPRAFGGSFVPRGLGFASLDSESSTTDVEDGGFPPFGLGFKLRAVEEEEEESGLAGYEDEDENDVLLSPSSSFGSVEDFYPKRTALEVTTVPQLSAPAPMHENRPSISKWTFPRGAGVQTVDRVEQEVDRFFGCLEDLDDEMSPNSPRYSEYDEEKSKGMFAKGFGCSDAKSCFVLPASVLASADASFVLDVVEEEEEEEAELEEEEEGTEGETVVEDGEVNYGIKITFTPPAEDRALESPLPVSFSSPRRKPAPVFSFLEEDDESEKDAVAEPFNFGRPRSASPVAAKPPPSRPATSSIPRPTAAKPLSSTGASPPRSTGQTMNTFATPPTKRGGTMPSFIPRPSSPSSPPRINLKPSTPPFSTNASTKPSTTFIRQPLMSSRVSLKTPQSNADATPHAPSRYADNTSSSSDMTSVDLSDRNIPAEETRKPSAASNSPSVAASSSFSSIMSSPLAGRLSFQTITNYIPSWGMTPPSGTLSAAIGHDSGSMAPPAGLVKRGFVSKQSQLERLKTRLERETMEGRSVGIKSSDEAIFL